jgi:photosynthetic reaction center cytochrome c subunit
MRAWHPIAVIVGVVLAFGFFSNNWTRPPVKSVQEGYRGLGMVQTTDMRQYLEQADQALPAEIPEIPSSGGGGPTAGEQYQNVQVLQDLSSAEFLRLMTAITNWVSPQAGCNYCHEPGNLASDKKYTKVVSRRMIQMTRDINENWKAHVANTGVTCYTCHRGNPVPANIWFSQPDGDTIAGQNHPSMVTGYSSLPGDPYTAFLAKKDDLKSIRVVSTTALPEGNRASIKQTEYTYGLMMSISSALGVNCTYCHNSRSFMSWDQSSPRRKLAWHGIQMVRNINQSYVDPLKSVFPANRLGPHGQVPQVACATCHQGAPKPLGGVNLVKTFPSLQVGSVGEAAAAPDSGEMEPAATDDSSIETEPAVEAGTDELDSGSDASSTPPEGDDTSSATENSEGETDGAAASEDDGQ